MKSIALKKIARLPPMIPQYSTNFPKDLNHLTVRNGGLKREKKSEDKEMAIAE
ncbi:MAG: hypothetical protein KA746_09545 [Pyrinomonadaceae bacterium]|nr:hypothetical protein [Pyrinomonadaceae bacterium]